MDPTEPNDTQPAPTPEPAAPVANSSPALTVEAVQRMIEESARKAFASGAAAGRREAESRVKGAAPSQPAAPQPSTPHAPPDYSALRTFDRALGKFDLSDDALAVVEEDFARANPPDPAAWVSSRANAYGWRPRGAQPTAPHQTTTTAPASPAQPHTPMPGSTPPATPVLTSDTPIMTLLRTDPSQVDRLVAQLGPVKFNERMQAEWRASNLRVKR